MPQRLVALGALLFAVGCVTTPTRSALQQRVGTSGVTAGELRVQVRERVPRYVGALERLADDAGVEASSLTARAPITRFEIEATTQMQLALFRPDPLGAVIDAWALTLQLREYLERMASRGEISEGQRALADRSLDAMTLDLESLFGQAVGSQEVSLARTKVTRWVRQHPIQALSTRPSTVGLLASVTGRSRSMSVGAAAGSLVELSQDLVDRLDALTALVPRQARWQAEYLIERGLRPIAQEGAAAAVDAGLAALVSPPNLGRVRALVQQAVEAGLRASLGLPVPQGRADADAHAPASPKPSGQTTAPRSAHPSPGSAASSPARHAAKRIPPVSSRGQPQRTSSSSQTPRTVPETARGRSLATQLASESGRAAAQSMAEELRRQLGPGGEGPLGIALAGAAQRLSAATVQGMRGELVDKSFPQCQGADRARCVQENLARWSGVVSAGVTRGVRSELGVWPVVFGFAAGAGAVLLVWLGWALRGSAESGKRSRGVRREARA